jgi:hypothetical protein
MPRRKEFSILKWLIFPSMSLSLAAIVAWFNLTVFGLRDGIFYIVAVSLIAAFSISINKYVRLFDDDDPSNDYLAKAAFVFEILLILALGANAIYSLSVQRDMSIARQTEQSNIAALQEIKQLKSRQAQRDATRMISDRKVGKSAQEVFAENERPLLWLMAGEMLAYIISAFSLYGMAQLRREKRTDRFVPEIEPIRVASPAPVVETAVSPAGQSLVRSPTAAPTEDRQTVTLNGKVSHKSPGGGVWD